MNSTITADSTVRPDQAVTLTLQLRNGSVNVAESGHEVQFAASGGTSTGWIGPAYYQGSGRYTASYTGMRSGTAQTITATLDGEPIASSCKVRVVERF